MSDPQPLPQRKTPRRADPLQPDRPGSGDGPLADAAPPEGGAADPVAADGSGKEPPGGDARSEQGKQALENVREGYG